MPRGFNISWRAPLAALARVQINWLPGACALAVLGPVAFLTVEIATWVRNIPNWDEFDTVLDFLVTLDSGASAGEMLRSLVAVQNEHRTVVSRLMFAAAYWLFGGTNFVALAVLGNLFLAGVFVRLMLRQADAGSRLRFAAIFALAVFQLQHHESLFWAGASIDHFLVVLAAVCALGSVTSERPSLLAGCGFGLVATFSLAHGMLVWPIGGMLLWHGGRRRESLIWAAAAVVAVALFLTGFEFNAGHRRPGLESLPVIAVYWLTLLGSSPALGDVNVAPWLGAVFVLTLALLFGFGRLQPREKLAVATLGWCMGAMAMIAWGRALLSNPWTPITSRYVILSSIAWALIVWVLVERALVWRPRVRWGMPAVLAGLAAFNFAANAEHASAGRVFAQNAEKAVLAFHRDGTFEGADTPLYPDPARADLLIREVEGRDIFHLPRVDELELCETEAVELVEPREIGDAVYFVEAVEQDANMLSVRGWAFRPRETARPGEIALVFRSRDGLFAFEPTPRLRPDVAEALQRWDATYAGFELRLALEELPAGVYDIGVCFDADDDAEFMMTANQVAIPAHALALK